MAPLRMSSGIFYTLRPAREGQPPFTDVKLPGGTIIRRVDEALHRKALANAARALTMRPPASSAARGQASKGAAANAPVPNERHDP